MVEENVKVVEPNKTILQQKIDSFKLLFDVEPEIYERSHYFKMCLGIEENWGVQVEKQYAPDTTPDIEADKLLAFEGILRRLKRRMFSHD